MAEKIWVENVHEGLHLLKAMQSRLSRVIFSLNDVGQENLAGRLNEISDCIFDAEQLISKSVSRHIGQMEKNL